MTRIDDTTHIIQYTQIKTHYSSRVDDACCSLIINWQVASFRVRAPTYFNTTVQTLWKRRNSCVTISLQCAAVLSTVKSFGGTQRYRFYKHLNWKKNQRLEKCFWNLVLWFPHRTNSRSITPHEYRTYMYSVIFRWKHDHVSYLSGQKDNFKTVGFRLGWNLKT